MITFFFTSLSQLDFTLINKKTLNIALFMLNKASCVVERKVDIEFYIGEKFLTTPQYLNQFHSFLLLKGSNHHCFLKIYLKCS